MQFRSPDTVTRYHHQSIVSWYRHFMLIPLVHTAQSSMSDTCILKLSGITKWGNFCTTFMIWLCGYSIWHLEWNPKIKIRWFARGSANFSILPPPPGSQMEQYLTLWMSVRTSLYFIVHFLSLWDQAFSNRLPFYPNIVKLSHLAVSLHH